MPFDVGTANAASHATGQVENASHDLGGDVDEHALSVDARPREDRLGRVDHPPLVAVVGAGGNSWASSDARNAAT